MAPKPDPTSTIAEPAATPAVAEVPPAPPRPPPERRSFPDDRTPHDRCDVRAVVFQAATPRDRAAALDELAECAARPEDPGLEADRRAALVRSYREAMLEVAFVGGALSAPLAARLVDAGLVTAAGARELVAAREKVDRLLRAAPGRAAVGERACRARLVDAGVELTCTARGPCGGGCGNRWFQRATIRLEAGALRLVKADYAASDEANGSCGCCM